MSAQIVFLIDLNQQPNEEKKAPSISDAISLTSLRLLHFLSSKIEKSGYSKKSKQSHTAIKWGYKFFTSKSHISKFEQHKFRDFKLKHFEEFEGELQRRLENGQQIRNNQNKKSNIKPVDCIKTALTDVLSDFPWEKPDLMSPVRRSSVKNERHKRDKQNAQSNFVVLFSSCPKTHAEMKIFSGRKVPDDEVFLDSLLPPSLFEQFCQLSRLSLSWSDTQSIHCLSSADKHVLKIIQDALVKTRGNLFHTDSIVPSLEPGRCCRSETFVYADGGNLPFTTIFSTYLLPRDATTANSAPFKARLELDNNVVCDVTIAPSLSARQDVSGVSGNSPCGAPVLGSVWRQYGIMDTLKFRARLHPTVYVCTDSIQADSGQTDSGQAAASADSHTSPPCVRLAALLKGMRRKSTLLVLLCLDTGRLAVLQPLTASTATVSVVDTPDVIHVEKALLDASNLGMARRGWEPGHTVDDLVTRLVAGQNYNQRTGVDMPETCVGTVGGCADFGGHSLDRWQVPGCKPALASLIDKLNDRLSELNFLTPDEAGQLRQLQRAYRDENKPPGLRDTPATQGQGACNDSILEDSRDETIWDGGGGKSVGRRSSQATVSRGKMIYDLCRSREVVKGGEEKGNKEGGLPGGERQDKGGTELPAQLFDFASEDDMKLYLTSTYARLVSGEVSGVDVTFQSFVTVVLHYMKQQGQEEPEKAAAALLEVCLVVSGAQLREKYASRTDDAHKQEKITEYQCQVVLRLEILSSLVSQDQTLSDANDEVVGLLRALSFVGEQGLLPNFLQSCLLTNYVHSLPRTLANIYDELMQPLPDCLTALLSPSSSADRSVLDTSFTGDIDPPSSHTRSQGPGSNSSLSGTATGPNKRRGGRKLVHHPSLADFPPQRQIFVEKLPKQKDKDSRKKNREHSTKTSKDKVSKNLFDRGPRGGVKLERRQSVAVMETTTCKTPRKTPKKTKSKLLMKSPGPRFASPRRKRLVADTPCHKQVSQALWQSQNMRRHSLATEVTTEVIAESPIKDMKTASLKDTPTKAKRAKALLRRSFYSAGPVNRTRNLTQYFQLADKIAGRKQRPSSTCDEKKPKKLLSIENMDSFKSPNKNSSFLLSQLISSPSPAKVTPRKLNMTPGKPLPPGSPSMNTRRRTASVFASPSSNLLLSPVSRGQSQRVLVADSGAKNCDISPKRTPEKSPVAVCGAFMAGLDSPSQNTRLKISATPTRKSVRAALFAKSPAANRYQSPQRSMGTASPRTLLSRFSSPRKLQAANENLAHMSPRKPQTQDKFSYKSPCKLTENGIAESIKIIKVKELLSHNISSELGSQPNNKHRGEKAMMASTNSDPVHSSTPTVTGSDLTDASTKVLSSESNKPMAIQRTPSPNKKAKAKTPESFDKWHRRKPRVTQNSPSKKPLNKTHAITDHVENLKPLESSYSQNTEQSRTSTETQHNDIIGDTDIAKHVFSPRRKRNYPTSPESVLSPCKRRRTITSNLADDSSIQPSSLCDTNDSISDLTNTSRLLNRYGSVTNSDCQSHLRTLSSPKGRKRSLLPSPESFSSPSKRQRTHITSQLHSLSKESSFPLGSQGFDITDKMSQSSQLSSASSLEYFSVTNDDVFLTQDNSQSQHQDNTSEVEDGDTFPSNNFTRNNFASRNRSSSRFNTGLMHNSIIDSNVERSESPIFGSSIKRHRNLSRENGKLFNSTGNSENFPVREVCSPRMKNSPTHKPVSVTSPPTQDKSSACNKYSPVVSANSLMHLIQSPLLRSSVKENIHSPLSNRTHAGGERSRRSLKLQNM